MKYSISSFSSMSPVPSTSWVDMMRAASSSVALSWPHACRHSSISERSSWPEPSLSTYMNTSEKMVLTSSSTSGSLPNSSSRTFEKM